jgi:hypothetical protein
LLALGKPGAVLRGDWRNPQRGPWTTCQPCGWATWKRGHTMQSEDTHQVKTTRWALPKADQRKQWKLVNCVIFYFISLPPELWVVSREGCPCSWYFKASNLRWFVCSRR